jgi:hypothetical protein
MTETERLLALDKEAQAGSFLAAFKLEQLAAKLLNRCPCERGCPESHWDCCGYWEVVRDFSEHGRPRLRAAHVLKAVKV